MKSRLYLYISALVILLFSCSIADQFITFTQDFIDIEYQLKLKTPVIKYNLNIVENEGTVILSAEGSGTDVTYNWSITGTNLLEDEPGTLSSTTGASVLYTAPESNAGSVIVSCYASRSGFKNSSVKQEIILVIQGNKLSTPEIEATLGSVEFIVDQSYAVRVKNPTDGITYNWTVSAGTLSAATGATVTYTAGAGVADPVVTCYASKDGFIDSDEVDLNTTVRLGRLAVPTVTGYNTAIINEEIELYGSTTDTGITYNWTSTIGTIDPISSSPGFISDVSGDGVVTCYTSKTDWYDSDEVTFEMAFVDIPSSELILWLDANDLYTITMDGSNLVSEWDNKCADNNHFVQATDTRKPRFLETGLDNGVLADKNTIRFNTNDVLICSSFQNMFHPKVNPTNPVVYTAIFVVFNCTALNSTSWQTVFTTHYDTSYSRSNGIGFISSKISPYTYGNRWNYDSSHNQATYTRYLVSYIFDGSASPEAAPLPNANLKTRLWINGSVRTINFPESGNAPPYYVTTGPVISASIGAYAPTAGYFNGDISEIIVYKSLVAPMSDADRIRIENYLNSKWGVF